MTRPSRWLPRIALSALMTLGPQSLLAAQGNKAPDNPLIADTAANHTKDGRAYTTHDIPTFAVSDDGTVDWPTYSGYRRYHAAGLSPWFRRPHDVGATWAGSPLHPAPT